MQSYALNVSDIVSAVLSRAVELGEAGRVGAMAADLSNMTRDVAELERRVAHETRMQKDHVDQFNALTTMFFPVPPNAPVSAGRVVGAFSGVDADDRFIAAHMTDGRIPARAV